MDLNLDAPNLCYYETLPNALTLIFVTLKRILVGKSEHRISYKSNFLSYRRELVTISKQLPCLVILLVAINNRLIMQTESCGRLS